MRTLFIALLLVGMPVWWALRRGQNSTRSPAAQTVLDPAPALLHRPGRDDPGDAFVLRSHLRDGHGYPLLDFAALDDWVARSALPDARRALFEQGRRAWLLHLRDRLGGDTALVETAGAWVLSSWPAGVAAAAASYVTEVRGRISGLLRGLAQFPQGVRNVLVVLDTPEQYYEYIANYYPDEGEFAFSSGIFVAAGCPHFVAMRGELSQVEPVIAHEMTHNAVAHLDLPLWLNEGIAVNTEHQLSVSYRHPREALELMDRHRVFWTPDLIQEFWSGQAFHRTDAGNELSYDLARAMVALIGREWESFARFAQAARSSDAGLAAARVELGVDLGDLAAGALGLPARPGWTPRPDAWQRISHKA